MYVVIDLSMKRQSLKSVSLVIGNSHGKGNEKVLKRTRDGSSPTKLMANELLI